VRLLDNLDPQVHPHGRPSYLAPRAELLVGDVRNREDCTKALKGIDTVVHAAGAVGVAQSLYKVEHYVDVNVRGTATLLQCLAERRRLAKLIVLTSMTGYGEGMYRRPSDGMFLRVGIRTEADIRRSGWEIVCPETTEQLEPVPTPETGAFLARNVYALTKRYQEELALSLCGVYDLPVVCLRMFNVYGPRQSLSNPYTGVLAIFLSRLLAGESPVIYEDGGQTRDFVSVHDVVDAILAAMESSAADGEVLNIGSGVPRRIKDVAHTLAEVVGAPEIEPTITGQFRRGDVRHCVADIRRAQQLLGFAPRVAWIKGLDELVLWCRGTTSVDRFPQADQELRERGLLTERMDSKGTTETA
jgi:dTDP-L-rhamnose 4-epimerase